ncbi:hypothetical protein Hanom_Chr02g00145291 [Helianthus anomalus]
MILELGVPLDNLCEKTLSVRRLRRRFPQNNVNQFVKPIVESWCYYEDYEWVTVVWNDGQEDDPTVDNILTEQRLGLIEQLCNSRCLNAKITLTMASLEKMFKWRLEILQDIDAVKTEDEDEHFDEESEE